MLLNFFKEIYFTYISIAPYLFLGLVFAGLLHVVFKKDFVAKHLGKNNIFSVIKAAVLGVPLPLCSCGVIPTAIFFKKEKSIQRCYSFISNINPANRCGQHNRNLWNDGACFRYF